MGTFTGETIEQAEIGYEKLIQTLTALAHTAPLGTYSELFRILCDVARVHKDSIILFNLLDCKATSKRDNFLL